LLTVIIPLENHFFSGENWGQLLSLEGDSLRLMVQQKARKDSGDLFKKDGQGAQSDFQTHTHRNLSTLWVKPPPAG
jgi:hypothetical protein